MTNRELPALPEWMDSYLIPGDAFDGGDDVRLSDRMRAYGSFCYERGYATASLMMAKSAQLPKQGESVELCRAAPAGGDARTVPFSDWMEAQHELGELRTMLARSAPAGSGEVGHEVIALIDALIDAVWDEADSGVRGTHAEAVKAGKATELAKYTLLRKLQQGVE